MATSLQTANYGFGKYAPNDVTSYLTDYNGAMDKIDGSIKGVSDVANEAKATGDSNLNTIASLSEELTATNKNVENLGKAQTAQQTEINNIKAEISNIEIGNFTEVEFLEVKSTAGGGSNSKGHFRKIGNGVQGSVQIKVDAGTYNVDRNLHRLSLIDIGSVGGNVLNLNATVAGNEQIVRAAAVLTNNTLKGSRDVVFYFDNATSMTRIALVVAGKTTLEEAEWLLCNF